MTIWSHTDLEDLLRGFNAAYNARRQRVLEGKPPDGVVRERLKTRRKLARSKPEGRAGSDNIAKAASSLKPPRRSHDQTAEPIRVFGGRRSGRPMAAIGTFPGDSTGNWG